MRNILIILSLLSLSACATSTMKLNELSLGMNKKQVLEILGPPYTSNAEGNTELLEFLLRSPGGPYESRYVRLTDGKVVKYGDTR